MRKIARPEISRHALKFLEKRTALVERAADQKSKCISLWNNKKNKAFSEIKEKLSASCASRVRCMYCEDSEATDIEHFYPKSAYPLKAFFWPNYLLACANCNSNYKRGLFPVAADGLPLLLNPMDDDPLDHLVLSLSTGIFEANSQKGAASIEVFSLNRQILADGRRDAWSIFCELSINYGLLDRETNTDRVSAIVNALANLSFSGVLSFVKKYFDEGVLRDIASTDLCGVLDANREILDFPFSMLASRCEL